MNSKNCFMRYIISTLKLFHNFNFPIFYGIFPFLHFKFFVLFKNKKVELENKGSKKYGSYLQHKKLII